MLRSPLRGHLSMTRVKIARVILRCTGATKDDPDRYSCSTLPPPLMALVTLGLPS